MEVLVPTHPQLRGRGGRGLRGQGRGRGRGRGAGAAVFRNAGWRRPGTERAPRQEQEQPEQHEQLHEEYAEQDADMVEEEPAPVPVPESGSRDDDAFDTEADVPGMEYMALQTKGEREAYYRKLRDAHNAEFTYAVAHGLLDEPGVRKRLEDSITLVGTCEQMCPLIQSVEREIQARLSIWEKVPNSNNVDLRRAVKYYERATGDKIVPSDVRPPTVLKKTLDYLFHSLMPSHPFFETHDFVSDRARAVRNDFTLQHINDHRAIHAHYRVLRYHILALHYFQSADKNFNKDGESKMIGNCLESLKEYWEDVGAKKDKALKAGHGGRDVVEEEDELEFWLYQRLWHVRDQMERREAIPDGVRNHTVFKLVTRFRKEVQDASRPITKVSSLKVNEVAMSTFAELAMALKQVGSGGGGGRVMTYMFACLVEWLFGKGTIEDIEDIRGDWEDWEVVDGVEREGGDTVVQQPQTQDDILTEEEETTETVEGTTEGGEEEYQVAPQPTSSVQLGLFGVPVSQPSTSGSNPFANPSSNPFAGGVSPFGNKPSPFGPQSSSTPFGTGPSPFGARPSPFGPQPTVATPTSSVQATSTISLSTFAPPSQPAPTQIPPQPTQQTSPFGSVAQNPPPPKTLNPFAQPFVLPSATTGNPSQPATTNGSPFGPGTSLAASSTPQPASTLSFMQSPLPPPSTFPSKPAVAPPPLNTDFQNHSYSPPRLGRMEPISLPSTPTVERNFFQTPATPILQVTPSTSSLRDAPPLPTSPVPSGRMPPPQTPSGNASLKSLFKGSLKTTELGLGGSAGELSPLVISPAISRQPSIRNFGDLGVGGESSGGWMKDNATFPSSPSFFPPNASPLFPSLPSSPTKPSFAATEQPGAIDLESRAKAITVRVLGRTFKTWRARAAKERRNREEIQRAGDASEEYHRRVKGARNSLNGGMSASVGTGSQVARRGDTLNKSWGSSSVEKRKKRPRPTSSTSYLDDNALAKRFEENQTARKVIWMKGSFATQLARLAPRPRLNGNSATQSTLSQSQSTAKSLFSAPVSTSVVSSSSKASSDGLPWSTFLSLNEEREGTAIWIEEKFTASDGAQPEWLAFASDDEERRGVLVIPPSSHQHRSSTPGPGLVVFELTPPREEEDELERKYVMLDDLVRLRGILRWLGEDAGKARGGGRYVPAVLVISWEQGGEAVNEVEKMLKAELAPPSSDNTLGPQIPAAISSYAIFRPSLTALTLDADFFNSISTLDLDWEGKRGRYWDVKGVWKSFDTMLEPFVNEWAASCSSWEGKGKGKLVFDFGLYTVLLKTLVEIASKEEDRLRELVLPPSSTAVPEISAFPSLLTEDVDDDEAIYDVALEWLSATAGDEESRRNIEMYRALGKEFPVHPFIEHIRRIPLHRTLSSDSPERAITNGSASTSSSSSRLWIPHHILTHHKKMFEDEIEGARAALVRAKTLRRRRRRVSESESPSRRKRRKVGDESFSSSSGTISPPGDLESFLSVPASRSTTPQTVVMNGISVSPSRSASPEKEKENGKVTVSMLRALAKSMREKYIQPDS